MSQFFMLTLQSVNLFASRAIVRYVSAYEDGLGFPIGHLRLVRLVALATSALTDRAA